MNDKSFIESTLNEMAPQLGANTVLAINRELESARMRFPTADDLLLAFFEESGELVQAMLDSRETCNDDIVKRIRKEAIQAAAMAIRILHEGDAGAQFPFKGIPRSER